MVSNVDGKAAEPNALNERTLRVAFVVEQFPSISETFILDEIVGALRRGIDVDIYAVRRGTAADIHPQYLQYGLDQRTFSGNVALRTRIAALKAWATRSRVA